MALKPCRLRCCRLITALIAEAEQRGCYKTILDCSEENVPFYRKCDFEVKGVQMVSPPPPPRVCPRTTCQTAYAPCRTAVRATW